MSESTVTRLDAASLKAEFPILQERVEGKPLVYLDNAATTQKPRSVIDALVRYYTTQNANVHRGVHELARRATEAYEGARARVAEWLGASSAVELVWTRGASEAINLVAATWGEANVGNGDGIVVSEMEHHSNLVPWQLLAERKGARLSYLGMDDEGRLRLDELPGLLDGRTRVVALNHASNALGTINPIESISETIRERCDAIFVVDGAQGVPHLDVDVARLGCDFYAFSGHKMLGPTGIGGLWGRSSLLEQMPPYQGGGEMIETVTKKGSTWAEVPYKFEAGTPHIEGAVGLAAAVEYLVGVGYEALAAHEQDLTQYAMEGLEDIPGVRVLGPRDPTERLAVLPFVLEGAEPQDVATILDSLGVAVRAGHHCAQLVLDRFGLPATTRASFYLYNSRDDVDRLVDAVLTAKRLLTVS